MYSEDGMKHIDEHTLMLFALRSSEVEGLRTEIERHLAACRGCSALADEIGQFYRDAENEFAGLADSASVPDDSIVPSRSHHANHFAVHTDRATAAPLRNIDRVRAFVRRRPYVTGTGVLALCGAIALMVQLAAIRTGSGSVPSYVRTDEQLSTIAVYDRNDARLFDIPVRDPGSLRASERNYCVTKTIVDTLVDGEDPVVITGAPLLKDPEGRLNVLRVFDKHKTLVFEKVLGSAATFRGNAYSAYYGISGVRALPLSGSRGKDLIVGVVDARSPCCVYRLKGNGDIAGTYWHFGHMGGIYLHDLDRDGGEELILCGLNDVDDNTNGSFPAIAVLDPSKLQGATESSGSRGFGCAPSEAERYYIRIERAAVTRNAGMKALLQYMRFEQDSSMTFSCSSGPSGESPDIALNFGRDFVLRKIWMEDPSRRKYYDNDPRRVEAELEEIRASIRYWDGETWTARPTRIRHRL